MRRFYLTILSLTMFLLAGGELQARNLLTIVDADGVVLAEYDREQLLAMPLKSVDTETPWTDAMSTFEGVLIRDLLAPFSVTEGEITAFAMNDYAVTIPVADFYKYPVILAMAQDGRQLRIRDKGPLWVIYPWSENDEINNDAVYARSIWQLKSIVISPAS